MILKIRDEKHKELEQEKCEVRDETEVIFVKNSRRQRADKASKTGSKKNQNGRKGEI